MRICSKRKTHFSDLKNYVLNLKMLCNRIPLLPPLLILLEEMLWKIKTKSCLLALLRLLTFMKKGIFIVAKTFLVFFCSFFPTRARLNRTMWIIWIIWKKVHLEKIKWIRFPDCSSRLLPPRRGWLHASRGKDRIIPPFSASEKQILVCKFCSCWDTS